MVCNLCKGLETRCCFMESCLEMFPGYVNMYINGELFCTHLDWGIYESLAFEFEDISYTVYKGDAYV